MTDKQIQKLRTTQPTQPTPWRVRATSPDNYAVLDAHGMWVCDVGCVRSEAVAICAAVNSLEGILDEIERLRDEDAAWSDLCNEQNRLLQEKWKIKEPQGCGWCLHAAGDTDEARQALPTYTLAEVREHTKTCPNNPLVAEIASLRAALVEACDLAESMSTNTVNWPRIAELRKLAGGTP